MELLARADMVNQAVGDALSGLLLVEAALRRKAWGLREWAGLYADLPSRQLKVGPGGGGCPHWPALAARTAHGCMA